VIGPIPLDRLSTTAHGVTRPEDVQVTADGRLLVSDAGSAVAEVLPDGTLRRFGAAGGEPNGIAPMPDGSVVIANFAAGVLQRVDLGSGAVDVVLDAVGGQPLGAVNYPLLDRAGSLWVSSSTRTDPVATIASGEEDGFVFRLDPDGSATVVAGAVAWPNCMTFDAEERFLYACRSSRCDVVRFPIEDDGGVRSLGPAERYGPQLGDRRPDEFGPEQVAAFGYPEVLARWGLTDGCAFDGEGNLWVTLLSANRIVAITPALEVVTVIDDPDGRFVVSPTSVAFGGPDRRTVYVGSLVSDYVVAGPSPVPGQASAGQTGGRR
jgi:sugar lactone lactonase YvrE